MNCAIIVKFGVFLLAALLGYLFSIWGWNYIYNQRQLLGAALVFTGGLLCLAGLFFWLFG